MHGCEAITDIECQIHKISGDWKKIEFSTTAWECRAERFVGSHHTVDRRDNPGMRAVGGIECCRLYTASGGARARPEKGGRLAEIYFLGWNETHLEFIMSGE